MRDDIEARIFRGKLMLIGLVVGLLYAAGITLWRWL